jgi:hypothetical protein
LVAVSIVPLGRLRVTEQEFEAALSASREEDRKLCRAYIAKSHNAVAKHMLRSPFAILLLVPLVSFVLTALGISVVATLVRQLASGFKLLDRAAYAEGLA